MRRTKKAVSQKKKRKQAVKTKTRAQLKLRRLKTKKPKRRVKKLQARVRAKVKNTPKSKRRNQKPTKRSKAKKKKPAKIRTRVRRPKTIKLPKRKKAILKVQKKRAKLNQPKPKGSRRSPKKTATTNTTKKKPSRRPGKPSKRRRLKKQVAKKTKRTPRLQPPRPPFSATTQTTHSNTEVASTFVAYQYDFPAAKVVHQEVLPAEIEAPTPQHKTELQTREPKTSRLRQLAEPVLDSTSAEFWAFVDSFLKEQNSAHTRRAYENDLVDFFGYLKATTSPMNVHTMVNYRSLLESRVSDRTGKALSRVSINRKIATIKSFLNWLVLNGVMPNNPAKAIKSFRAGRESPTRDISDDMVRRMLDLPNRHRVSGRMHHAIMMILFHMGLRRSELVDLKTTDLFEQSGMKVLRVRGKGDKERILPLPEAVSKSINDYLMIARKTLEQNQPLFTAVKNNVTKTYDKPLHPNAVAYIIKIYASKAGVPYNVSPHSARATAVSNALDHKASHRAVQHMAGWSNPLMVSRYDKRSSDLKNSAVRFVSYDSAKEGPIDPAAKPDQKKDHGPK